LNRYIGSTTSRVQGISTGRPGSGTGQPYRAAGGAALNGTAV